jgi:cysteinyl-tRNA synthetase
MSKSRGNFITLQEIETKGYSFTELRLALLSNHYRSQNIFSWETLKQAKINVKKINNWLDNLKNISTTSITSSVENKTLQIEKYQKRFEEAMNDDLNTPLALSIIYELITKTNKNLIQEKINQKDASAILSFWEKINQILGLTFFSPKSNSIPSEVQFLAEERKKARINNDFKKSDKLRNKIFELGFMIQDKKNNTYKLTKNEREKPKKL